MPAKMENKLKLLIHKWSSDSIIFVLWRKHQRLANCSKDSDLWLCLPKHGKGI